MADQVAHLAHLNARDTTLAYVSRAPQADIERWKARMGWEHPLVHDHRRLRRRLRRRRVARHQRLLPRRRRPDLPHLLHRQPRRRGAGQHLGYLDITALGRQEEWEDSPEGYPQTPPYEWWNLHDEYGGQPYAGHLEERCVGGGWRACVTRLGRDMTPTTTTLRIERTFQAPAEAVFDAWTSEEVIRRWLHAEHDWETTEAEVDLRVGGAVRVVMRDPDKDVEYGGGGHYTEIDPPTRLAFTWIWDGDTHADADRDRLRGDRRRHHGPLHPQRPVGRGGGPLARRRLERELRQPRTHPSGS